MKYWSTELDELFDSEEALVKAEKTKRAKEVEKAFKDAMKAQQQADELLNSFIKDYGSFHATFDGDDFYGNNLMFSLFDKLFN